MDAPGAAHPSPLASQLEIRTRDLNWTLANYAFVANVTALASECDIAHSPTMSVASCRALPTLGLTFVGDSAELLANYAAFLADPGSVVQLVVNEDQLSIAERAFSVTSVTPRWQMLYHGTLDDLGQRTAAPSEGLRPRRVEALANGDWVAVQALAEAEAISLPAQAGDPFQQGPAFGVWDRRRLIAMGLTAVCLPGAAQINAVVTRKEFRRQGYATAVVTALLRAHLLQGRSIFLVVDQDNAEALSLLDNLGFVRERPMYAMRCILGGS
ncbi:MAG: GNAT family N-acetyltransferase [Anaerolineae bacterium]|jgi:ribosomal protein S18 acetylase RimI-like enzyme|nr:GNAT family N-acetyltransferase [Anaerolineae bacterium]